MGWFKDLFIVNEEVAEEPPLPAQVVLDAEVGAAIWPSGRCCTWDLLSGERLGDFQASGPSIALSGQRLVDGAGTVRDLQGAEIVQLPVAGVPRWLGPRVLVLGWNQLWLGEPGEERPIRSAQGLDVSGAARVVRHGARVAILDPQLQAPWLLDLEAGTVVPLGGYSAPVHGGCWHRGLLHTVQKGEVVVWEEGRPSPLPPRHGLQTLDLLSDGQRLLSLGLDAQGEGELLAGDRRLALPRLPSSPRLALSALGPVAETWCGFERLDGPGLELPKRRGGRRPLVSMAVGGQGALLGTWPVTLYRLSDATCRFQLPSEPAS